ncbi:MAG: Helix-turn-helix domain protein [Gemmataceae bacterium]|nr:Helix-turn-helix domain protein [Gemmataceae bacterium]
MPPVTTPSALSNLPPHPAGAPWSVQDAATFLCVSARHLLRLGDGGKLRTITLGRRRLVPDDEVHRLARAGC